MVLLFSPGSNLRKLLDSEKFQGESLSGKDNIEGQRRKLVDGILLSMIKKFSDINEGVLNACKIADLSTWPTDIEEVKG